MSGKAKDIIVLTGFTASGKDSILTRMVDDGGYHRVVSHTSRPIRPNEVNGREYHFISKDEFLAKKDEFLEVREYHTLVGGKSDTWFYGVHPSMVSTDLHNCVVLDILGLRAFKEHYGDRVLSFFLDAHVEIRKERCRLRGDYNELEFNRRLADDRACFPVDVIKKEIDEVITSTTVDENFVGILSTIIWYEHNVGL